MSREFSRVRSEAIRSMLVDAVELARHRSPSYRTRSLLAAVGLVAAGLVVGGAVSAAAVTAGFASHTVDAPVGVPAPDGVLPGAPIITVLGAPRSQAVTGSTQLTLAAPPPGSTHVRVAISCITPGTTSWGFGAARTNAETTCTAADLQGAQATYLDFVLSADNVLEVRADAGVSSMVTYEYLTMVETAWGVNANGESFGVVKSGDRVPDLVAATGVDPSGKPIDGYVRASDLAQFAPGAAPEPSSPAEALNRAPSKGWDIPLYASDGKTQIGVDHVGE